NSVRVLQTRNPGLACSQMVSLRLLWWCVLQPLNYPCFHIQAVSAAILDKENQLSVLDAHALDVNMLHVFLQQRNDNIAEDGHLPKHLVGGRIPSLHVGTAPVVI